MILIIITRWFTYLKQTANQQVNDHNICVLSSSSHFVNRLMELKSIPINSLAMCNSSQNLRRGCFYFNDRSEEINIA